MSRKIHCIHCWNNVPLGLHQIDQEQGYRERVVFLGGVKAPPGHGYFGSMLQCDRCGEGIPDGSLAVAYTTWNKKDVDRPIPAWESNFGTVIDGASFKMVNALVTDT